MRLTILSLIIALTATNLYLVCRGSESNEEFSEEDAKWPTIGVSVLVKNKAHSLPFALTCLQLLDYPKDRIYVWFYMDSSADESLDIVETWAKKFKSQYSKVYVTGDKTKAADAGEGADWTEERLRHIIQLREKALDFAKKHWADYIFMLDADVFLTEPSTLKRLVHKKGPIVAPMLLSDGLYSNFWDAMSEKYYYEKTEQYEVISNREATGCFQVPMVHSAVLVDLRSKASDLLTYEPAKIKSYSGPIDDIIAFAISAKDNNVPMLVCNDQQYGFLPVPVDMNDTAARGSEADQLLNVKMEALSLGVDLPLDESLSQFVEYPARDRLGVDRVFTINLARRERRRALMLASFRNLGVDATIVDAVDGRNLNMEDLTQYGITLMPKYEDSFHKRPMKAGEVGCFLSHYGIWKEIAARQIPRSLVLEDDIKFAPFFRRRFQELLRDLDTLDWELVYLGRKILSEGVEEAVAAHVVRPRYSYWTLGYLLSEAGARRLLHAEPLGRLLPVDEFLPIMFDDHPNDTWKAHFRRRELRAFSAAPLLLWPTHYTGQPGYVSDTEDSRVLPAPAPAPDERSSSL